MNVAERLEHFEGRLIVCFGRRSSSGESALFSNQSLAQLPARLPVGGRQVLNFVRESKKRLGTWPW